MSNEEWIRRLVDQYFAAGVCLRPFLPNPRWRGADVFIVGYNAANSIPAADFGDSNVYWEALTSDPSLFWRAYCHNLKARRKRNPTNRNEYKLAWRLYPLNVLVTNLFPYPSPDINTLPKEERNAGLFRRLVNLCKPKVLILHGDDAIQYAQAHFSPDSPMTRHKSNFAHGALPLDPGNTGGDPGCPCLLLPTCHLSRWERREDVTLDQHLSNLARQVHERLGIPGDPRRYKSSPEHPCDRLGRGLPFVWELG